MDVKDFGEPEISEIVFKLNVDGKKQKLINSNLFNLIELDKINRKVLNTKNLTFYNNCSCSNISRLVNNDTPLPYVYNNFIFKLDKEGYFSEDFKLIYGINEHVTGKVDFENNFIYISSMDNKLVSLEYIIRKENKS